MFTAHDAGHRGITHSMFTDTLIGVFIADFCCGLSIGWWKSSHNVHHLITNHPVSGHLFVEFPFCCCYCYMACDLVSFAVSSSAIVSASLYLLTAMQEHDPDIQNVPLFSTCPSFIKSIHSTYYDFTFAWDAFADFVVPYQKYTYYPVMGIARFNLYILSIHHLLNAPKSRSRITSWVRPTEIAFIACYWFWFGYCLVWRTLPNWPIRIAFVLISHIITMPLHVQITLSHWGMSTSDLGEAEAFPQRQLRTTMDVDCPAWLDFIHGGLQFQAVHHLFPQVPRHNLRKLQALVREFCEETGIKYSILNFVDGNKEVLGRLGEVAAQVDLMVKCQRHMAETGESGVH
jgi:sphingolipid 8-(E)-desaturase